jgi:hypothetical protein
MITYRTTKGSNLTHTEVDTNFYESVSAVEEVEAAKLVPAEIDSIELDNTKMTITMSDGVVHNPLTLPASKLSYRGRFLPIYPYQSGDLFYTSTNVYLVIRSFTSGSRFNPDDELEGKKLVVAVGGAPVGIEAPLYFPGVPQIGMIGQHSVARACTFKGVYSFHRVAPELQVVYTIKLNGDNIGTITFAAGDNTGVTSLSTNSSTETENITETEVSTESANIDLYAGDIISLHNSIQTLGSDLSITLLFRRVA